MCWKKAGELSWTVWNVGRSCKLLTLVTYWSVRPVVCWNVSAKDVASSGVDKCWINTEGWAEGVILPGNETIWPASGDGVTVLGRPRPPIVGILGTSDCSLGPTDCIELKTGVGECLGCIWLVEGCGSCWPCDSNNPAMLKSFLGLEPSGSGFSSFGIFGAGGSSRSSDPSSWRIADALSKISSDRMPFRKATSSIVSDVSSLSAKSLIGSLTLSLSLSFALSSKSSTSQSNDSLTSFSRSISMLLLANGKLTCVMTSLNFFRFS